MNLNDIQFEHRSIDKYIIGLKNSEVISFEYNKVLEKYADFGYETIGDFVLNMMFGLKPTGIKEYNIEKRNRKYAEKMYRDRFKKKKRELRKEYKAKGISITNDELDEIVYSHIDSSNKYIRFNALNDIDKVALKTLLSVSVDDLIVAIPSISVDKIKEIFSAMRETFDFSLISALSDKCKVSEMNRLLINLNSNIVIIDAFDLLSLFEIDLNYVLDLDKVKCVQYEEYKAQQEVYKNNIKTVENLTGTKTKAILNANIRMVYSALMSKGLKVMNSNIMVEGYSVFTYPIKMVMADLGLEDTKYNLKLVADSINILTALGLINKISVQKLRNLGRSDLVYDNQKGYDNNYFYVKPLDLDQIEERATLMKKEGVRIGNISHKIISSIFSSSLANTVFNKLKESFYTVKRLSEQIKKYGFKKVQEVRNRFNKDIDKVIDYFKNLEAEDLIKGFEEYNSNDEEDDDDLDAIFGF